MAAEFEKNSLIANALTFTVKGQAFQVIIRGDVHPVPLKVTPKISVGYFSRGIWNQGGSPYGVHFSH
jgi:hypothetical protein